MGDIFSAKVGAIIFGDDIKAETCRRLINKIITEEDNYWEEDEIIENNQGVDELE